MENILPKDSVPAVSKKSSFIKWSLILAIAIVMILFISYVVQVLYPEPQYVSFCPEKQVNRIIAEEAACLSVGGQWNENGPSVPSKDMTFPDQPKGYCNEDFNCSKTYEVERSLYNRNVFVVFVVSGILLLVGSVFLVGAEVISLGLSFAGVLALLIGALRYWSDMNELLRVILLGVALAGLLYVAWKKFRD